MSSFRISALNFSVFNISLSEWRSHFHSLINDQINNKFPRAKDNNDAKNQSKNVAVTICRHMVKEYPIGFFQSNGNLKSSPYFLKKKKKEKVEGYENTKFATTK